MTFLEFLRTRVRGSTVSIAEAEAQTIKISLQKLAIQSAVNKIAQTAALYNFGILKHGEFVFGADWFAWNFEPNANQNKQQFMYDLVSKLIYEGAALCVKLNNEYFIADSFTSDCENCGFGEAYFRDVQKNNVTLPQIFPAGDVCYYTMSNQKIRQLLVQCVTEYSELLTAAGKKYKKSSGQKGILNITAVQGGTPEQVETANKEINENIRRFFEAENAVLPLRKGQSYDELGKYNQKESASDIPALTKEVYARVAEALDIPLPLLYSAEESDAEAALARFCKTTVQGIIDQIVTENNRKLIGRQDYLSESARFIADPPSFADTLLKEANNIYNLIGVGVANIDEIRIKKGLPPKGTWWSTTHFLSKNFSPIDQIEQKGEKSNGKH